MADVELYWGPGSCARVPFIALEEAGADFTLHVINRFAGEAKSPEYLAVNPKGKVPTLVVDGWILTENPAIQTYIAGAYPEAGLLPTGDERTRLEALSTMAWFASGMHPHVGRLRFPANATADGPEAYDGIRAASRAELEKGFEILERRLADREWLFGDWSIVDGYMLWLWFRATGSGMDGTPFPRCGEHAMRNEQRPAVARVLDREELDFSRFVEAGSVPEDIPPHQVGRAPDASVQRTA
jgi:glutathione S-transferase